MSAPIAVAEPGRAVTLLRPAGDGWTVAPLAPSGAWPAWRPGHAEVALSVVHGAGDGQRSAIELVDLRGNRRRSLFESPAGADAAIAPNVPHYALWSPDGARLAFVAQGRAGLTLFVSEAEGPLIADPVQTGGPIFLAWSPDGRRLAVHAGVNLSLLELAEARASRPLSAEARGFRAPAFSPDGALLAHATPDAGGEGVIVRVARTASGESAEPHRLPGGVALSFRPGARTLTAAVTTRPSSGAFDEMWALDLDASGSLEGPPRRLLRQPFVSAYWNPAGDALALVVPSSTGDGAVSLHARGADGAFLGASAPFMPSPDYRMLSGFFDQYGLSHRLWAPDGSGFLAGGRLYTDAPAAAFADGSHDAVLHWRPARGAPLEPIGEGGAGFFPPAPLEADG